MQLTIKVKHNLDLASLLVKLGQAVKKALLIGNCSSKHFKEFSLPSTIVQNTARKYLRQRNLKTVKNLKGILNNQAFQVDANFNLKIPCLKCSLKLPQLKRMILKFCQIEFDHSYFYITCYVSENEPIQVTTALGVDFNTKGNTAFIGIVETGLAFPLGVSPRDLNLNYLKRIAKLQSKKKFSLANRLNRKRTRRINDNNHKVSRQVVDLAKENNSCIVLENLTGIRNSKCKKEFGKSNWRFYDLRQKIEYKAKLEGVPVYAVSPSYTSKTCSKCGHIKQNLSGKCFRCEKCGYDSHRDLNASFNIASKFLSESASKELDLEVSRYAAA